MHFWEKVIKTKTCWLWVGNKNSRGYGQLCRKIGTTEFAHRVSYELIKGEIPKGMVLDHLCRVHNCVNPDHLEPVTNRENIMRGIGVAAENAKKTHCPKGHQYSNKNYKSINRKNKRRCIKCESAKKVANYDPEKRRSYYIKSKKQINLPC